MGRSHIRYVNNKLGTFHGVCGDEEKLTFNTTRYSTKHKRMKQMFQDMSEEELQELKNEKAPNGCASELALEVQKYLYKRRQTLGY